MGKGSSYRMSLWKLNLEGETWFTHKSTPEAKVAICIDTETTGMDHVSDKIIEIGIVVFEYDQTTGNIIRVCDRYSGFEDPGRPLPAEIKEITGITDEMIAGQEFDNDAVLVLGSCSRTSLRAEDRYLRNCWTLRGN